MATQTLYETLQVSENASPTTIRAAYERLSAQWDPVRPYNNDAQARAHYAAIKNAYVILGNPEKRAAYDRKVKSGRRATDKERKSYAVHLAAVALMTGAFGAYHHSDRLGAVHATAFGSSKEIAAAEMQHITRDVAAPISTAAVLRHDRPNESRPVSEPFPLKLDVEFTSGNRLTPLPAAAL
jgi:DnaJ-class molecular chaperone